MKAIKQHKVIVVGLPKTGTSTLDVMLRILGYHVTGPDIDFQKGDEVLLNEKFVEFDAFQDYPWCFEWQNFVDIDYVKFIVLTRNKNSWWKSFYDSYGRKGTKYLSYPYLNIEKEETNKSKFLDYFDRHYNVIKKTAQVHPNRFLFLDIKNFEWKELCYFLGEDIPKNLFGQIVKKPHVNKHRLKTSTRRGYNTYKRIKKLIIKIIGIANYNRTMLFLRKNNLA